MDSSPGSARSNRSKIGTDAGTTTYLLLGAAYQPGRCHRPHVANDRLRYMLIVGGRRLRHLAYVADVVIEFVVPEDAMVKQLLRNRDELDFGYTQDCFEAAAAEHFVIAETERLQSGTRTIYYLRPKHAS